MNKKNKNKQSEEEIVYDDNFIEQNESEVQSEESLKDKIITLKNELKNCRIEKQEYLDGWQRSKADYVNLKKRNDEEKKDILNFAAENIVLDLLPTIDNFEMAFKNKDVWNSAPENWRVGITYIYEQLLKTLEDHGFTQLNPVGDFFNPNEHHSIENVEIDDEDQDNKIIEVQQKGFKFKDKIIRPTVVKVGQVKKP